MLRFPPIKQAAFLPVRGLGAGWPVVGTVLLALLSIASLAATPGDLDADGKVSVADHLLLQQHLRGERALTPGQTVAADLDGNGALSPADLTALRDVLLERFPPAVIQSSPANLAILNQLSRIDLTFNKRFHDDGNLAGGLNLIEAGPDRHLGTADDVTILGSIAAAPPALGFDLGVPAGLGLTNGPGTYRLSVGAPIADFQGRPMVPFAARFLVLGDDPARDSDFDGIPDLDEITLQTHPLLADTDADFADDLLERDSNTNPLDPESIPGEAINPRTRMIVFSSLPITYANHPGDSSTTAPDWVSVRSPVVSYANLPYDMGTTPVDWVSVRSPVVSYANLVFESGTTPANWVSVRSAVISYANLPSDVGATPANWVSARSPVVSYANMPLDPGATPPNSMSVRSPVASYYNAPVDSANPGLSETITVASPVISYRNTASL